MGDILPFRDLRKLSKKAVPKVTYVEVRSKNASIYDLKFDVGLILLRAETCFAFVEANKIRKITDAKRRQFFAKWSDDDLATLFYESNEEKWEAHPDFYVMMADELLERL